MLESCPTLQQRLDDLGIGSWVDDDCDIGVVFRSGTNHGRPTNIYLLNDILAHSSGGDGLHEGVKVHYDKPNRCNVELLQGHNVAVFAKIGQYPTVNFRVKGLDPAIQRLWESRHLAHIPCLNAGITEGLGCRASRDDFNARLRESLPQVDETGLVAHGNQGTPRHGPRGFAHRAESPS